MQKEHEQSRAIIVIKSLGHKANCARTLVGFSSPLSICDNPRFCVSTKFVSHLERGIIVALDSTWVSSYHIMSDSPRVLTRHLVVPGKLLIRASKYRQKRGSTSMVLQRWRSWDKTGDYEESFLGPISPSSTEFSFLKAWRRSDGLSYSHVRAPETV